MHWYGLTRADGLDEAATLMELTFLSFINLAS
jgi:hypothetical protein